MGLSALPKVWSTEGQRQIEYLAWQETTLPLRGKMQSEENLFIVKSSTTVHESLPRESNGVSKLTVIDETFPFYSFSALYLLPMA